MSGLKANIIVFKISGYYNGKYDCINALPNETAGADYSFSYPSEVSERYDFIINKALNEGLFNIYDYVLIMNFAGTIEDCEIDELFLYLQLNGLDMVVPRTQGEPCVEQEVNWLKKSIYVDLNCFLIKTSVLQDLGGFYPKFCHLISPEIYVDQFYVKIPYAEIDFCMQMHKRGYRFSQAYQVIVCDRNSAEETIYTRQQLSAGEDLIWYRHHLLVADIIEYQKCGKTVAELRQEKIVEEYPEPVMNSGYETNDDRPLILWHYAALLQCFKKGGDLKWALQFFHYVFSYLNEMGYQVQFIRKELLDKACAIVFMDCPGNIYSVSYRIYELAYYEKWLRIIRGENQAHKLILSTAAEPPVTSPAFYDKAKHSAFRYCLTSCLAMLDGEKYFYQPAFTDFDFKKQYNVLFEHKKLCTFICGGFFRKVKDNRWLYQTRLDIVSYFDQNHKDDFDFWGYGWEDKGFHCYRGIAEDRIEIFSKYKFVICIPNSVFPVDEFFDPRIFDAMVGGSIPIYLGCPDIKRIVPANTFIDLRDFSSYDELYEYISRMDRNTYQGYIKSIEIFLASNKAKQFSVKSAVKHLVEVINKI